MGGSYNVQLRGFDPWVKEVMNLVFSSRFDLPSIQAGTSELTGDKCHQLRYFIWVFNERARNIFHLGPNVSFDEGGVHMQSRYCPVQMYNKDKPDKFCVDFFIMADSQFYFIYHLDVYQGKNTANIDVHHLSKTKPSSQ